MEEAWRALAEGRSDFVLYGVVPSIVVTLAYLAGSLFCFVLDRVPGLRRHKIQARVHEPKTWRECLRYVFLHKLTSEIPLTFAGFPIFVAVGVSKAAPLPGVGTVLWQLAAFFVVEDAWHYMAHRSLHAKWAYRKIHHIHHKYTAPFGAAANFAHPLETLWTGFGTLLPVILFAPHLSTMLLWIVVRQWQAISVHAGFDFPWRPSRVLPFVGGARFHDRHHQTFNCNYAPTFVWFDRLFGTADEKDLGRAHEAPAPR